MGVASAAFGLWLVTQGPLARPLGLDDELRGSQPPAGQQLPDLSTDTAPQVPPPADLRGAPTLIVATCIGCRSGDVFGGFLRRFDSSQVPTAVQLHVVVWGPRLTEWLDEYPIADERLQVHAAPTGSAQDVQRKLHVGESGVAYIYDRRNRWVATYHLGQLDERDITHDLRLLAAA